MLQTSSQQAVSSAAARHNMTVFLPPLTRLAFSFFQNHPVSEAAEDQRAAAESDRGLWPADGHVLHGERGKRMTRVAGVLQFYLLFFVTILQYALQYACPRSGVTFVFSSCQDPRKALFIYMFFIMKPLMSYMCCCIHVLLLLNNRELKLMCCVLSCPISCCCPWRRRRTWIRRCWRWAAVRGPMGCSGYC